MNVLILTPDAVGSTLLQRMLTIYMQFHDFGRPVINLHELTNGLARYYSPEFNQELVSKYALKTWGYHQSLPQVVEMLSSVDHYKTSRLAPYQSGYALAKTTIDQMVKLGIMISGPPIKKQTLDDKHRIIKNFDELIKVYNCWIDKNPSIGEPFDDHTMQTQISSESNFWHSIMNSKDSVPALPPIQQ